MPILKSLVGLTRLGIKPESTAQETAALYHSAILVSQMFFEILLLLLMCNNNIGSDPGIGLEIPLARGQTSLYVH